MFDWSRVHDHTAIHCKTEQEANRFLSECGKHEIKWCTGDSAEQKKDYSFSDYGTNTAFFLDNRTICFGDVIDDVDDYAVIGFSDLISPIARICCVLGGEDNPLKIGENFKVANDPCAYFANRYGVYTTGGTVMSSQTLFDIINHPEKIIRHPQFTDNEILLMRAFVANGYPWVTKTIHGFFWISKAEPDIRDDGTMDKAKDEVLLPEEFFPSLKKESKLNMTEYLESEESKK